MDIWASLSNKAVDDFCAMSDEDIFQFLDTCADSALTEISSASRLVFPDPNPKFVQDEWFEEQDAFVRALFPQPDGFVYTAMKELEYGRGAVHVPQCQTEKLGAVRVLLDACTPEIERIFSDSIKLCQPDNYDSQDDNYDLARGSSYGRECAVS